MWLEIASIAAAVSAFAAMIAAFLSWQSHRKQLIIFESGIYIEYRKEYSSHLFANYLRFLVQFKDEKGDDFSRIFCDMAVSGDADIKPINDARRAVKFYFETASDLNRNEYISDKILIEICKVDGINIYFDIVIPLEIEINTDFDLQAYEHLKKKGVKRRVTSVVPIPAIQPSNTN